AGSPAGDVEEPVIHGKVDVGHQRRHCAKPLQEGRQLVLGRRLGRDRRRLLDVELAAFAPPGPDRAVDARCRAPRAPIEPPGRGVATPTPKKPYSRTGSCAGRTSSTIWWLAPRSIVWTLRRARRSQKWIRCPYLFESRSSGTIPFSNCGGSPHSLVTM